MHCESFCEAEVKDQQWVVPCLFCKLGKKDTLFGYKQETQAKSVEVLVQDHSLDELRLDVLVKMKIVTRPVPRALSGPAPDHISAGLSALSTFRFGVQRPRGQLAEGKK